MTSRQDTPTELQSAPQKRSLSNPLKAAALLSALYFLSKLTGLFQQQIIAAALPGDATDAYTAAFRLTDFLNYLVAGGVLSITFIPIFTELRENGREDEAWEFFSSLCVLLGLVITILVAICMIGAAPLTRIFTPGLESAAHPPGTFDLTVAMTRVILPGQIFFVLGGLIVGVLNAQKRFGATGFTGAVYNVVAMLVAVVWWLVTGQPIAFAVGILIGACAGYLALPLWAVLSGPRDLLPKWRLRFRFNDPLIRQYFVTALPIMLGVSFPVVDQIVVGRFASYLDTGALSHLSFGNRLMIVAQSVLAQAASVAAFPYLASDSAAQDWKKLSAFLRTGLRRLMFITLPLSTLMILTARPVVDLIFGWGHFRGYEALHDTATAYAFYSVGLFAWAGQQLVARGFYALKDTKTPTIIGSVITIFFFIPLVWLCLHGPNPILLLSLATSVGACTHFAAMTIALETKLARKPYNVALHAQRVCGTLLRTACACAIMAFAGLLMMKWLDSIAPHGKTGDLVHIFGASAIALPAFALAAQRFEIPEWKWLWTRVVRRIKK